MTEVFPTNWSPTKTIFDFCRFFLLVAQLIYSSSFFISIYYHSNGQVLLIKFKIYTLATSLLYCIFALLQIKLSTLMDRSTYTKRANYSYYDTRFYQPAPRMHTTQTSYEEVRGNQQQNTFRRKKVSDCHNLNYSSCLNPFARAKNVRYDQTNR